MKKIVSIILVVAMVFSMSACSTSEAPVQTNAPIITVAPVETAVPTEVPTESPTEVPTTAPSYSLPERVGSSDEEEVESYVALSWSEIKEDSSFSWSAKSYYITDTTGIYSFSDSKYSGTIEFSDISEAGDLSINMPKATLIFANVDLGGGTLEVTSGSNTNYFKGIVASDVKINGGNTVISGQILTKITIADQGASKTAKTETIVIKTAEDSSVSPVVNELVIESQTSSAQTEIEITAQDDAIVVVKNSANTSISTQDTAVVKITNEETGKVSAEADDLSTLTLINKSTQESSATVTVPENSLANVEALADSTVGATAPEVETSSGGVYESDNKTIAFVGTSNGDTYVYNGTKYIITQTKSTISEAITNDVKTIILCASISEPADLTIPAGVAVQTMASASDIAIEVAENLVLNGEIFGVSILKVGGLISGEEIANKFIYQPINSSSQSFYTPEMKFTGEFEMLASGYWFGGRVAVSTDTELLLALSERQSVSFQNDISSTDSIYLHTNGNYYPINIALQVYGYDIDLSGNKFYIATYFSTGIYSTNVYKMSNGNLEVKYADGSDSASSVFILLEGSEMHFDNVQYKTNGTGILSSGPNATVNFAGGLMEMPYYCVATNASVDSSTGKVGSYGLVMNYQYATFTTTGDYSIPVFINVPGELNVDNCVINSKYSGVLVRGGTANITNTTINCDMTSIYYDSVESNGYAVNYFLDKIWTSGTGVQAAGITLGNREYSAYAYDTLCTLDNVVINMSGNSNSIAVYAWGNSKEDTMDENGDTTITLEFNFANCNFGNGNYAMIGGPNVIFNNQDIQTNTSANVAGKYDLTTGEYTPA